MSCARVIVQDLSYRAVPELGGDEALYRRLKLVVQERETTQAGFRLALRVQLGVQCGIDTNEGFSYRKHLPKLGLEALLTLAQRLWIDCAFENRIVAEVAA